MMMVQSMKDASKTELLNAKTLFSSKMQQLSIRDQSKTTKPMDMVSSQLQNYSIKGTGSMTFLKAKQGKYTHLRLFTRVTLLTASKKAMESINGIKTNTI